ncbi:hypothetical protein KGM_208727 [Danaus plexippus plexippus]|uniref:Uncharacterized protein n=1 Tax=Danaus plexippus plexippus TaxID=278856 RepID=A0A212EZV3_DANPL|nr:hypothetical protein KGM_208727 [Danaus plexippus plexippus]
MPSPRSRDSCSFTCDDLASFVTLAKILDDKEPEKEVPAVQTVFNAEEIIMKLVNALIYATTHSIQNHCQCPHSVTPSLSSDKSHRSGGGAAYPSNGDNDHLNEGLVNLDLLNSKRKNNVLDLDLSNHHVLGVGLGTKNQNDNSYQTAHRNVKGNEPNSSGRSTTTSSDDLLNVSLLDSKQPNNVAAVSIGKQNVVGVGLGGIGETNGSGKQVATQMSNDRNEDLVNLQVLNPNKDGNVANLAVGGQNVLGVGLGN